MYESRIDQMEHKEISCTLLGTCGAKMQWDGMFYCRGQKSKHQRWILANPISIIANISIYFFGDTTEMIRSSNKPISAIAWATENPSGITHSGVKTMIRFPRERFGDPNLA